MKIIILTLSILTVISARFIPTEDGNIIGGILEKNLEFYTVKDCFIRPHSPKLILDIGTYFLAKLSIDTLPDDVTLESCTILEKESRTGIEYCPTTNSDNTQGIQKKYLFANGSPVIEKAILRMIYTQGKVEIKKNIIFTTEHHCIIKFKTAKKSWFDWFKSS
jgi:hypothetical protein